MSNIQRDDIVEFFYENGERGFGLVINVHDTRAIGFATVAVFDALGKYIQIPFHRVKNTWRNLEGYVTTCDILRDKNARLKEKLETIKKHIVDNRDALLFVLKAEHNNATYCEYAFCQSLLEMFNAPDINDGRTEETKQMSENKCWLCKGRGEIKSYCDEPDRVCSRCNGSGEND